MPKRQHVVSNFFESAEEMRGVLDAEFKTAYAPRIPWQYVCDPKMYTYLKTAPEGVFPDPMFTKFMQRLREWTVSNLGLAPWGRPALHLMINGCRLGLHSDFHNGAWGYVYSLTRWDSRRFAGGETLLFHDGIPSYKKHHVQGEALYELVQAHFNQLLVFDDRIVHATPTIEGSMDPLEGRIAMVGHIRATSPLVTGPLRFADIRGPIQRALEDIRDKTGGYKEVQGTVAFKLAVRADGAVESATTLTDNLITPQSGYDQSDVVSRVKATVRQCIDSLRFPASSGPSELIVPVLVPVPNLKPIEATHVHSLPVELVKNRIERLLPQSMLRGSWEGDTCLVSEPIVGTLRVEAQQLSASFDAPMWVPSQRARFEMDLKALFEQASGAQ